MWSDRGRESSAKGKGAENGGYRYRERLDRASEGRTVLQYLSERYAHSTEEEWRSRIAAGRVLVDGVVAQGSRRLRPGEELVWHRPPWREPEGPSGFALLHADPDVLGVAKPRGLATMPGGGFLEKTLLSRVRRAFPGASPLHRLGRGPSGIVLFSRSRASRRKWTVLWPRVVRDYRALVEGAFPSGEAVLDFPIGHVPHPLLGTLAAVASDGKPSRSTVRLVERRTGTSLVDVRIATGRTHQIRIHLAAAGYPLAGDRLYRAGGAPFPGNATLPGETGYWLHAHRLELDGLVIECAPPPVLRVQGG